MLEDSQDCRSYPIDATPFEAFRDGAWHGIDRIRIRNGSLSVKFNYYGSITEENIRGDYLRMRSRRSTSSDCSHFLKPGVDVCVLSPHLCGASSDREAKVPLHSWRDARLIQVKKNPHVDHCLCLFAVIFYKNEYPSSMERAIAERKAEIVMINNICILQRIQCEEHEEGYVQWSSTEDCISCNKSKLLSDRFSSEVAWLIVLSTLRGMEFDIKLTEGKIIYQIIKGDQSSLDWMSIPPGFGKNMKIISFRQRDESLRPMTREIPVIRSKKHIFLDGAASISMKSGLENIEDVEILYEHMNLRHSKRLKIKPERFTSYDSPNFHRIYKKKAGNTSPVEEETTSSASSGGSWVKEERSSPELQWNSTTKQRTSGSSQTEESSFTEVHHKSTTKERTLGSLQAEEPSCTEVYGKNKTKRSTPGSLRAEEPSSTEKHQKSTTKQTTPANHISYSIAQNEKINSSATFFRGLKSFTSSCNPERNSEPAFCRKQGRKRKRRISEREFKKLIEKCIGNIKSEMERDAEPDGQLMDCRLTAHSEEDFTWPSSADSLEEKDELEELWKDMEFSLTKLALLEQKQMPKTELVDESTTGLERSGEILCHHDCVLNEEFGITCRLCNLVCTETKYILPPLFNGNCYRERHGLDGFGNGEWMVDPSILSISRSETSQLKDFENVWASIPDLEPKLLPHQRKAFEFIWKNLSGSLQIGEMNHVTDSTGGCVVAHTPGSGKTLLLISFLVSYLKVYPRSRPLVLAPKAALHTWCREFEKWGISVPIYVAQQCNKKGKPMGLLDRKMKEILMNARKPSCNLLRVVDSLDKIRKWHEHPSVLLMTYSSFLSLTKEDSKLQHRAFVREVLLNNPGLLILDEGHNPRSTKSKLRKILMKVKTEFRILLSGTLFQNNFEEYFNTLCLARPRFVDDILTAFDPETKNEKRGRRPNHQEAIARNIFIERVGQKIESSNEYIRKDGINLLNKLTCGFIDSFEGAKLNNLPGLQTYALFMKPTDIQQEILAKLTMAASYSCRYPLEVELLITIGSIHPWLIQTSSCVDHYFRSDELKEVEKYKQDFTAGCKAKFVVDLVHKSTVKGERVLIFCHNVAPINFLVALLEVVFGWRLGEEVLVLQGEQELPVRSDIMDKFNGDTEGKRKVLLASTTACAEGISLTGASRLVMLDSEWNHSRTRQAIARAFRPGQERMVYVYLLLTSGTWEEDKYNRNTRKAWISKMVFFGHYVDYPSPNQVLDISDDVLRELVDEDETKAFHMIVKKD